jgi:TctA family transporter
MTKQGQPKRALSLAYSASFVGGMISILALLTLAPNLAAIAHTLAVEKSSSPHCSALCW